MAEEQSWLSKAWEAVANFPSRNMEHPPSFSAQMGAMGREAIKDVRDKMFETFFGQREGPGEMGAPMNPTQYMVTQDLGVYGHQSFDEQLIQASQRGGHDPGKEMERG